jgi:hypothetical protein
MATSWTDTRPVREDSWATPHQQWSVAGVLLAIAISGVLLAGLYLAGQSAVCAVHDGRHPICEGYEPIKPLEEMP